MSTISKSLSTKTDANGYTQVLFLVRNGRKSRLRIKSGVFVPEKYWNEKKQTISIPKKIGVAIADELQVLRDRVELNEKRVLRLIEIYEEKADKQFIESALFLLKDYEGTITENVVNTLMGKAAEEERRNNRYNLFDLAEDFFIHHSVSTPRQRLYRTIFRTMARYQLYCKHIKKNGFCWDLEETTKEDILDFFEYIANENVLREQMPDTFKGVRSIYPEKNNPKLSDREPRIEPRGANRIVDMKKCVKAFWNWLIKSQYTENNPFNGVEIGVEKYGTPYYLTIEERNLIANSDFSGRPKLEIQKDIFTFQCLIGCRVGDLYTLTADNVVNGILVYTPNKTKDHNNNFTARVPLSDLALSLIEKYKGKDPKGRLFPFISEQKYNEAIKAVLTHCEIKRKVNVRNTITGASEMKPINEIASSHMARRTFVGNAYKVVKDPNLIGRMSGHVEGSKAFVRYRDIDDDMLKEVINATE